MMAGFPFLCFIGAVFRLLFYRIIGRKDITLKYLISTQDEQQLTSLAFGLMLIVLFGFVIT